MSYRRLFCLFYKDITLFFLGRRKIRKKAEVIYFAVVFFISFFMGIFYAKTQFKTMLFLLSFTSFLYLLMSFLFELKHFIFFEEDIKIVKRLPVTMREYYISKGLLIVIFGILFATTITIGNFVGVYFFANKLVSLLHLFFTLLFNTFFSIAFSMFIYAILIRLFRQKDTKDIVAKVQVALGVLFGLIFAMAPSVSTLLRILSTEHIHSVWYLHYLPFTWFVDIDNGIRNIIISALLVIVPLFGALLLGFNEKIENTSTSVKDFSTLPFIKDRKKLAIFSLVLTHIIRSKITKRTLISPVMINVVVIILWSFKLSGLNLTFFGVWTLVFMSVITSLTLFISDSYRASWMLVKSPLKDGEIVATAIDAAFLFIVIPYALFVLFMFMLKGVPFKLAMVAGLYGLSASYIFIHLLFYARPTMIFSRAGYERGVNSWKELVISFIIIPGVAGSFSLAYKFFTLCLIKISIVVFLLIGYFLNYQLSRKPFIGKK